MVQAGQGTIPCAWEVTMNWEWLAPAMLEYFYGTATPNDYFVGGLSGPGYMYPKAIPPSALPEVVAMTRRMTRDLDLPVFEFMDYSEGATVEGNSDLTKEVVDAYYAGMPEATGFINGYAPSYTFAVKDGKPLISYDYYLSESRPEADAAADLEELAAVKPEAPLFPPGPHTGIQRSPADEKHTRQARGRFRGRSSRPVRQARGRVADVRGTVPDGVRQRGRITGIVETREGDRLIP